MKVKDYKLKHKKWTLFTVLWIRNIASSKDALRISEIGDDLFCASPKAGEIWMKIRFLYSLPLTYSIQSLSIEP